MPIKGHVDTVNMKTVLFVYNYNVGADLELSDRERC